VPNAKSAEWALAQADETRQVVTLPNAIDAGFFSRPSAMVRRDSRLQLGLGAEGRLLVQVSALTARKGVLELARAFLGLSAEERKGSQLLFVGEGDQRGALESLASGSNGAIRLLGQLPPEEVRRVLWAADAFVLNTHLDPNPLSAIEAAAAGLPILMSAAAGNIREVVEARQTGFVIRDPADPAGALRSALAASDDQLAEMGARAAELARSQFDAPAVAKSLLKQLYP
jgi:glycosyltransferase involved in cell wall biosynthesis